MPNSNFSNFETLSELPPTSEVPVSEPPPLEELVVPHPGVEFSGMDNIPESLLPPPQRAADELDHAGLEAELPGEDRAHPTDRSAR